MEDIIIKQTIDYSPKEILDLMERESVVLCDVRDAELYKKGHIPGAVNVPGVFHYLTESTPHGLHNMYEQLRDIFSSSGIHDNSYVIFYEDNLDTQYGSSCRGYLFLSILGHTKAGILKGGFAAWLAGGLPVGKKGAAPRPSTLTTKYRLEYIATKDDVLAAIGNPDITLLDNRDRPEWLGESSSPYSIDYAPRKGRIPGATWIEWYEFMKRPGAFTTFKSTEEILELCSQHGIRPEDDIIIYCFKGARASNTYIALKQAGFENLRIYFGSWNEWSRIPSLPIEEGYPEK